MIHSLNTFQCVIVGVIRFICLPAVLQSSPANPSVHSQDPSILHTPLPLHVVAGSQTVENHLEKKI